MTAFRKLAEQEVARGYQFTMVNARFAAPDGEQFERDIIRHVGAVAVVPLHDDGSVTLVRQFRPALEVDLLEVPAGLRDVDGEPDARTAARELEEEAGLRAERITSLVRFHNSPGFCDESVALFLATGLSEVPLDRQGVEEQAMTIERIPLDAALDMVETGSITDAKTIIGLTLSALRG